MPVFAMRFRVISRQEMSGVGTTPAHFVTLQVLSGPHDSVPPALRAITVPVEPAAFAALESGAIVTMAITRVPPGDEAAAIAAARVPPKQS